MRRLTKTLAVAGFLLALPVAQGHATGTRTWNVCGGTPFSGHSGFALCASVTATVARNASGQYILSMKIYNLSGTNSSYAGTVFTGIGLDNVIPSSVNVVGGTLKITGPCLANPNGCDYSRYWLIANDVPVGGGVRVDLASGSIFTWHSIASQCGIDAGRTPAHNLLFVSDCFAGGPNTVTVSFQVTGDFDPSLTGDLFVRGQNGPGGQGTNCLSTSGANSNCRPPTTAVVPEPITATLFATGMGIWGGVGYLRRRRKGAAAEV